jgi:hypothetical protein
VVKNIAQAIILGTDYLAKLGEVTYNFQACSLSIGKEVLPMGEKFVADQVRVIESVKIPPLSEVLIVAHVNSQVLEGKQCAFEGTQKSTPRDIWVGKSLDRVTNQAIRIPVLNTGNNIQEIQVNAILGKVEPVDDEAILMTGIEPGRKTLQNTAPAPKVNAENSSLTPQEMSQLQNLIDEFKDIIGEGISELGRTSVVQHVIETLPNTAPIRC